ncbi:MAG: 50S ribosomal protein L29 [Chloroflexi bacterium]|nr:50S ribosomal protein L29 [Chloroflexota bacterium]
MDVRTIREMTDDAILDAIEDHKEMIYKYRFQKASGQLENLNAIRNTRRIIARLKTVQRERQLAAAQQQTAQKE